MRPLEEGLVQQRTVETSSKCGYKQGQQTLSEQPGEVDAAPA